MNHNPAQTPRRSRLPWTLLGLVVAVIVGVTLYRQFGTGENPASELADRVTNRNLVQSAEADTPTKRSPGADRPRAAMTMADLLEKRKRMMEAMQARNQTRNAAMASSFAAEKADPAWSGAHEKGLASLQDSGPMRDAGVKAQNFSASCKTTMCRIAADFPNQGAAEDWLQLYMASVGDNLPVATAHKTVNPDGSVQVEIYGVGRKR